MRAGRERSLWPLSTLSAQLECPDRTGMFTTPLKLFAPNSLCLLSSSKCPDRTPVWNLHNSSAVIYLFVSNAQSSCCLNTSVTWKAVIGSCSSNTWEIICLFGLPCGIKYEPTLLFGMVATFFKLPTSGPLHRSCRSQPLCAECTRARAAERLMRKTLIVSLLCAGMGGKIFWSIIGRDWG